MAPTVPDEIFLVRTAAGPLSALRGVQSRHHPHAPLVFFSETPSTNQEAKAHPAPHGTVFVACRQTRGRGQHERTWTHHPANLAASWVVRDLPPEKLPLLGLFSGMCVHRALNDLGVATTLKWPNDVLIGNAKVAGLLVEAVSGHRQARAVIGLGLNVLPVSPPPDPALALPATSLWEAGLRPPSHRLNVLAAVLGHFWEGLAGFFEGDGWQRDYAAAMAFLEQSVQLIQQDGPAMEGLLQGVDHQGRLLLETPRGTQAFTTGRLRPID